MSEELQETLDLVLKASNEGIWDWAVGSDEIYYSDRLLDFIGYSATSAPNFMKDPKSLLLAEDAERMERVWKLAIDAEDEDLFAVDCRIVRSDQLVRWLRIRGCIVREQGKALRVAGSAIDITRRKRAEEALEEERTMLRLVIDNVPVQVYFKDIHSRFTMVNKRQAQWVGCESEKDLIGKSDADFYTIPGWKKSREGELQIMETGQPIIGKVQKELWKNRESTYVQAVKQPWYDSRGHLSGVFGVSTDVSVIVKSQERLEELALDLQARNHSYQEELGLAREVQQALLPGNDVRWEERLQCIEGLATIEKKYIPATELAGDYYDVISLGEGKVGLFICDVMGHGVRSALVVSMIRGLMEKAAHHAERPAKFLKKLNYGLCRILGTTDVDMFATASYVVADFEQNALRVACAGHDLPLMVQKGSDDYVSCCAEKGPALGFFKEAEYESCVLGLDQIDEVLLYTDGIYESANKQGEEWGKQRFEEGFMEVRSSDEPDELDRMCAKALSWVGGKGFDDDVCLLSLRKKEVLEK